MAVRNHSSCRCSFMCSRHARQLDASLGTHLLRKLLDTGLHFLLIYIASHKRRTRRRRDATVEYLRHLLTLIFLTLLAIT